MTHFQIPQATTIMALRARVKSWRQEGLSVGFVPTMGALHDGHIALVKLARAHCDRVVTSIFVNPAQFAVGEDLDTYPRNLVDDAEKLSNAKCDLIYMPDAQIMYPDNFITSLKLAGAATGLESTSRPHFFEGVAIVVAKLLNQVRPDMAVFGEKDYQQLLVIRQMVRDLDFGIDIISGETVREKDGLALSSRNVYLDEDQRQRAAQLNIILKDFAKDLSAGMPAGKAQSKALRLAESTFDSVDYIEARCADTLSSLGEDSIQKPARVLAAVRLGDTRLIDNRAALPS